MARNIFWYRFLFIGIFVVSVLSSHEDNLVHKLGLYNLKEVKDVEAFFPATVDEIETRKKHMIEGFHLAIDQLLVEKKPTFENTAYLYDLAFGALDYGSKVFSIIVQLYTDLEMQQAAAKAVMEITNVMFETRNEHPEIYKLISSIDTVNLKEEHCYYLQEVKKSLKKLGLGLPAQERLAIKKLKEELADLDKSLNYNLQKDRCQIVVTAEELSGMDDIFIQSLKKDEKGRYLLTIDDNTTSIILSLCQVENTRRQMYKFFSERNYSKNSAVLKDFFQKKHELAQMLDYDSYAHLQLSGEMAENPQRVRVFFNPLVKLLSSKQEQEFKLLKAHLPEGVSLNEQNQIQPWNLSYAITDYKKKHLDFDEENLKAYFPLETTLKGLIQICERFFDLQIEEVAISNLWHPDVRLLRVSQNSGQKCGFILLDLYSRAGKYTHSSACDAPLLPAWHSHGRDIFALSAIICHFSKGNGDVPTLMRPLVEVRTLFHEFGHALHDMLGRTDLISTVGTNTKRDFVELPSQMLEEWLWDQEILQMCSSHYLTGEKLPGEIFERMLLAKNAFSGIHLMGQLNLSNYFLELYSSPREEYLHYYSFGSLFYDYYEACYYGCLWSKVLSLDVFEKIKKEGLLNPKIGKKYIKQIIGKGGSLDPNHLLIDFLGRKPTQEAFLKSIGINEEP